jgi:parallel beta-helix repeat protein
VLKPGDVLLVRGGPVVDDEIWVRPEHPGQPGRPITIRNYPGERPILAKVTRPFIVSASHIAVSGFDFRGGKSIGLGTETTTDVRLSNSTFRGNLGFDAVGTHGNDVMVGGNLCDARGSSVGTQGHCFYISHGHRIRIVGNVGTGAPGYGVHIFDQERSSDDITREITDVVVEDNLLSGSTERSGLIVAMGDEGKRGNHISGVTIRRNTFTGNNFAGIAIGANVSGVRITGNTFRNNGRQGVTVYDEPTITDVLISGNRILQPKNGPCRVNCSWYRVAPIEVGKRAKQVRVQGNRTSTR